jgi:hypothetical protein
LPIHTSAQTRRTRAAFTAACPGHDHQYIAGEDLAATDQHQAEAKGENEARYHTSNAKRQCTLRPRECDGREDRAECYKAATKNTEAQQCDCILSRFGDSITLGFFSNLWREPPLDAGQSARMRTCRQCLSRRAGSGQ